MKRYWIILLLLLITATAVAHLKQEYSNMRFEFNRDGHVVKVQLHQNNVLEVWMDDIPTGRRTNFCRPVQQPNQ
jgi:uncharacterized protein YbaA (DUF1428 family)